MGNNTNHGYFFEVGVDAALEFRSLVRTPPDARILNPLLPFMMEGKSRADVKTFRRRDVETSRRSDFATLLLVDCCIG